MPLLFAARATPPKKGNFEPLRTLSIVIGASFDQYYNAHNFTLRSGSRLKTETAIGIPVNRGLASPDRLEWLIAGDKSEGRNQSDHSG